MTFHIEYLEKMKEQIKEKSSDKYLMILFGNLYVMSVTFLGIFFSVLARIGDTVLNFLNYRVSDRSVCKKFMRHVMVICLAE